MNELNYASLEASKKLYEAGIVLETEAGWYRNPANEEAFLAYNLLGVEKDYLICPAPCFTDVWRELPEAYLLPNRWIAFPRLSRTGKLSFASYCSNDGESKVFANQNPTDALTDLLVWLKGEGK